MIRRDVYLINMYAWWIYWSWIVAPKMFGRHVALSCLKNIDMDKIPESPTSNSTQEMEKLIMRRIRRYYEIRDWVEYAENNEAHISIKSVETVLRLYTGRNRDYPSPPRLQDLWDDWE